MLKKLLFISLFISTLYSQNISWHFNYDKALIQAHEENKNLFVLLVNDNQESKKLIAALYKEESIIKSLHKEYLSILINVNYKTTYPIELYYTTQFPTMFIANAKLELMLSDPMYNIKKLEEVLKRLFEEKNNLQD